MRGSQWCPAHHPDYQERRRRGAKKGGRGRGGSGRLVAVDKTLTDMISGVLDGSVERADAAVVVQACNARIRLTATEKQLHEMEELEERLTRIEARLEAAKADQDRHAGGQGHGHAW